MKLTQLTENFVISNDEFEDYLNRSTEQLKQELESGKNARDAIHDLALTFSNQHNKSYEAYERMTDSLAARMHTLELGAASDEPALDPESPSDMDMGPEEPAMDMDTTNTEEMPDEQEMADYDAVMNNKEEGVEESQSTSLKDKEDYIAKKKALQDIQMGEMDEELKKEVMRRKAELEDQAKKMGIKEEPETTMSIPAKEVPLAGDSIWDKEGDNPKSVKVSQIEVENPFEPGGFLDGDEDDGYRKVSVTHDGPWTIYTDTGFPKAISKMVKMNVDFTEQGMQKDGLADMETTQPYGKMEAEEQVTEENTYTVVHAKHGKEEVKAKTSYDAAKKYAEMKKLKGTSGVDAHLHTKEDAEKQPVQWPSQPLEEKMSAMDTIKKIVADKQNMPVKFDDGQMKVDLFTASAVSQVYDKVNDANKEKIDNMLKTKAGMLKIANFAMGSMKEGKIGNVAKIGAQYAISKGMDKKKAVGMARTASNIGDKIGGAMQKGKSGLNLAKKAVNFVKGQIGQAGGPMSTKKVFNADKVADEIVSRSARIVMSEYNDFYQALDAAAKAGKKKGDTIEVGGKKIKLKSDPKRMSDLNDSDLEKIDALAQKINELNQK